MFLNFFGRLYDCDGLKKRMTIMAIWGEKVMVVVVDEQEEDQAATTLLRF